MGVEVFMPVITFNPSGKSVIVPDGSSLLEAAKLAIVSVEVPCGGNGLCKKCLVRVASGKVNFENNGALSDSLINEGIVLICRTTVADEPVCIEVLSQLDKEQGKFAEATEDIRLIDKDLLPKDGDIAPLIQKILITVSAPEMGDGLSDLDRFKKAVSAALKNQFIHLPISLLQILPQLLRAEDGNITVTYFENSNGIDIVDIEASNTVATNYGVCIDIGTTTIAIQLVDMINSHILASKTDYNAQIECGLDVISRINYARKPERLKELRDKVLATINGMINQITAAHKIENKSIYNVSIAGNTVMMHLLMGIIPENIRLSPYTPAVYTVPFYTAEDLGIEVNPNTYIYMAPSVGSYVGGDITSGLLCSSLSTGSEDVCLFIDIGTNGEIIVGNNDFLLGCACSAGPAFEGGGIENGMRASKGAIELVEIDKETGKSTYSAIGGAAPAGICGSGLISLIANLFNTGWIDAAGKLNRVKSCESIEVYGKNARYIIAAASETESGKPIYITEADIDNLIRAKAAIFSACLVLLEKVQMDFKSLSRIYIAGGFGRYLNIEKSTVIGLIPRLDAEKFKFIGNSSVMGAYMTLVSKKHRDKELELAHKITYIDLSTEPEYMNQYTAAIFIPHTDSRMF
jgi:uncharacterized 2Fe-2S/4Fe-4S cluster protein (DUF4445 family)